MACDPGDSRIGDFVDTFTRACIANPSRISSFLKYMYSARLSSFSAEEQVGILSHFIKNPAYFVNQDVDSILSDYLSDCKNGSMATSIVGLRLAQRALRNWRAANLHAPITELLNMSDSLAKTFIVECDRGSGLYAKSVDASQVLDITVQNHINALHRTGCILKMPPFMLNLPQKRQEVDEFFGDIVLNMPIPASPTPRSQEMKSSPGISSLSNKTLFESLYEEARNVHMTVSALGRSNLGGNVIQRKSAVTLVSNFIRKFSSALLVHERTPSRKRTRIEQVEICSGDIHSGNATLLVLFYTLNL